MCPKHYKAWRRSEFGRELSRPQAWTDARRDSYHRRRAQKAMTATGDPVVREEIAKRDGYQCGICAGGVDMAIAWPHPMSPSMDHVVPLALGGGHVAENVQLAHLTCNTTKGARIP